MWFELFNVALVGGSLLAVVGLSALVGKVFHVAVEHTRKLAHFGGGLAVVFVPWTLETTWAPLLLTGGFFSFMQITQRLGRLRCVHGVARSTSGAMLYPLGVCAALFIAGGNNGVFKIAIMIMATSDALAALVGQHLGRMRYRVRANQRTVEGSFAFFVSAALIVAVGASFTGASVLYALPVALAIALALTACEAVSQGGTDNVSVPLVGALLLVVAL